MAPLCLGREVEARLVLEVDRLEVLELDGSRLGRVSGDPDRPLAGDGWIVDTGGQGPGDLATVARRADAGGPLPRRVAAVLPGRVVLDGQPLELARAPADPHLAPRRGPGRLAGPGVAALAVRTHALDRHALVELQIELDAPR